MSGFIRYRDEFKKDAVSQVVERGYSVSDVAGRLGISTKSLYTWKAEYSKPDKARDDAAVLTSELRQLKRELSRVTEERDILKKATAYFARESR
jgi:transposase